MALMIKGNCEKIVSEEKVSEFIELGYSLLDDKGKVIKHGNPQNKDDFRAENEALKHENASLNSENKKLIAENEALKAEIEKFVVIAESNSNNDVEQEIGAVKKAVRKKKSTSE